MSIFISKNFKYSEFACPDCGRDRPINPRLIYLLQSLRDKIGRPIYITSGLRCKTYNRKIGGYRYSPHLQGKAVDCRAKGIDLIDFAIEARGIGFTRIGLYGSFLHLDTLRPVPSASWVRDKKGKYHYFKTLGKAIEFKEEMIK